MQKNQKICMNVQFFFFFTYPNTYYLERKCGYSDTACGFGQRRWFCTLRALDVPCCGNIGLPPLESTAASLLP